MLFTDRRDDLCDGAALNEATMALSASFVDSAPGLSWKPRERLTRAFGGHLAVCVEVLKSSAHDPCLVEGRLLDPSKERSPQAVGTDRSEGGAQ